MSAPEDQIYSRFLRQQAEDGRRLSASSDIVSVIPFGWNGTVCNRFVAEFRCSGLAREEGKIVIRQRWAVGIAFPENYLRQTQDTATILTYLGLAAEPWHPNLRPPLICMHIAGGASLVEIVMGLFDLITWNVYSAADALNHEASQWARQPENRDRFPLERRPLKRRPLPPGTQGNAELPRL